MLECVKDQHKYVYDQKTIPREKVRSSLILKPRYFLDRGFSEATLDYFDVGVAKKPKPENLNRIIVPLYVEQDKKQFLAGYTCRSVFEKCPNCKLFHSQSGNVQQEKIGVLNCPTSEADKALLSKWRHVGFSPEYYLYNYWNAQAVIKETNVCILVEGPGDVWKLHQAGIRNAVGLFGNTLYDGQEKLLAKAQCMSMIIMTDSDQAGLEGARMIKQKYGRLYRMYFPTLLGHDAGDMNEDSITSSIKPILDKIQQRYS
jgi:5S rRNA maturation endonuclease (ribonuclease M5)